MIATNPLDIIVTAVQELSLARNIENITYIIRKAARKLSNSDGVCFILKDNGLCYYADEDAIGPLWKGQRFPMDSCISGWVMLNRAPAIIKDIYSDSRIPHEAYAPTFVKSLAMTPIRTIDPIGAIGCYWANEYLPSDEEVKYLQALADITAVSFDNLNLYNSLKAK